MQRTRRTILDILKLRGNATLEELARELELAPITVRSHLTVLERDGLISVKEKRGKVGRPHFVYSLLPKADELFPQAYADVANRVFSCLFDMVDPDQAEQLVSQVADCWAEEMAPRVKDLDLEQRVAEAADIRTEEGAIATWSEVEGSYLLSQHHCPCRQVAERHRWVCRAEQEYLRRLLDADVERIEYQLEGGRTCTYRVTPRTGEE